MKHYKVTLNNYQITTILNLIQKEYVKQYEHANNTFDIRTYKKCMDEHSKLQELYNIMASGEEV